MELAPSTYTWRMEGPTLDIGQVACKSSAVNYQQCISVVMHSGSYIWMQDSKLKFQRQQNYI